MKAAVVYISLTGNTAAMAERIIARLSDKAEVDVFDLSNKDFASALFGSYGWGDGEWMRTWQERCLDDGAILVTDPVIAQEGGDESTNEALDALADSMLS